MTVQKHLVGHGLQLFLPLFCLSPLARSFSAPSFPTVCLRKNSLAPFSAAFLSPSPRFQNGPRNCPRPPPLPYPYPTMLFFVFIRHFWRLFSLLPLPIPEGACKGLMAFLPSVLSVPYILCNNIQKGAMYCDSISLHRIPQPRFLSLFLAPPSPIEQHPLFPPRKEKNPPFSFLCSLLLFAFSSLLPSILFAEGWGRILHDLCVGSLVTSPKTAELEMGWGRGRAGVQKWGVGRDVSLRG